MEPIISPAPDFGLIWYSAREVLAGRNPYLAIGPGRAYNWNANLYYPLPAVLLAVPFAWLTMRLATATFVATSSGLLAFAVTRENWHRLPLFLSASSFIAAAWGQWSFAVTAAALLPWLGFVLAAKPTTGFAAFTYRPTARAVLGGAAILMIAFAVQPGWVGDWLTAVRTAVPHFSPASGAPEQLSATIPYFAPVSRFGGFLLVLAVLRWRRAEARYLLVLSFIPQTMVLYECVLLSLIPATRLQAVTLALLSYVAYRGSGLASQLWPAHPEYASQGHWIVVWQYLPCLAMVLLRPNVGDVPAWLERALVTVRRFTLQRRAIP